MKKGAFRKDFHHIRIQFKKSKTSILFKKTLQFGKIHGQLIAKNDSIKIE